MTHMEVLRLAIIRVLGKMDKRSTSASQKPTLNLPAYYLAPYACTCSIMIAGSICGLPATD